MAKSQKSWEHRLSGNIDDLATNFVESLSYDRRLYRYDIIGSIAHANMLVQQGLLTADEAGRIRGALEEIAGEIEAGRFEFDLIHEDIHMAVEDALIRRIGDAGRKLHTGRSRNDQVATDIRLWMRDQIDTVQGLIRELQRAFVTQARKYESDVMPAYTHLQRAQPIVIAAYLLSFVEPLERDLDRLGDCRKRVNVCPLGSGAVAGSTLPLDREQTARELGFDSVMRNSLDGVADRDFCAEFIFDCSMILMHLSRLAEDWIIYCSSEFSFIRIDDTYCTSSSMMPQKRNPDMLELMRGKTGSVYGALMAMLTILKAQPSTYNRDLQEDKIHVFKAADVTEQCLRMAAAIVSHTAFRTEPVAAGMDRGFLDATALAEYLVKKGVPFREAHGMVGSLVAQCEKQDKCLADLTLEEFRQVCPEMEEDVYETLNPARVTTQYATKGAAGPTQALEQLAYWSEKLGLT